MAGWNSWYDDDEDGSISTLVSSLNLGEDEDKYTLDTTPDDEAQGFGTTVESPYSRSRALLETENDIHLDKYNELLQRSLKPDYEMTPGQAFGTSMLALLPTALSYMYGGNELAAESPKLYAAGAGKVLSNMDAADKEARTSAEAASKQEYELYKLGEAQQEKLAGRENQAKLQKERLEATANNRGILSAAGETARQSLELKKSQLVIPGYDYVTEARPTGEEAPKIRSQLKENARLKDLFTRVIESEADPLTTITGNEGAEFAALRGMIFNAYRKLTGSGARLEGPEGAMIDAMTPAMMAGDLTSALKAAALNRDPREFAKSMMSMIDQSQDAELFEAYGLKRKNLAMDQYSPAAIDKLGVGGDFAANVAVESGGDQSAISPKGATGAAQLTPAAVTDVARAWGADPETLWKSVVANKDVNIQVGQFYRNMQKQRFGGSDVLADAAYNAGPGAVEKHGGVPPYKETQDYVRKVKIERMKQLQAKRGAQ